MNTAERVRLLLETVPELKDQTLQPAVDELLEQLATADGRPETSRVAIGARTVADYVPQVRRAQAGNVSETMRTYASYWRVLTHGIRSNPRWSSRLEYEWLANLAAVNRDRAFELDIRTDPDTYERSTGPDDAGALIVWPGYGDRPLTDVTRSDMHVAINWVRCRALAEARRRDHAREKKGLPSLNWTGDGAVETLIAATRHLYEFAADDGLVPRGQSPAAGIDKPGRPTTTPRTLTDEELDDLMLVCSATGNDPELDTLLLKFHLLTGARQEGAYRLRLRHLRTSDATVVVPDKNSRAKRGDDSREQERVPVPPSVLDELVEFAHARGSVDPDDPVFRYRVTSRATGTTFPPLTAKRYETIAKRLAARCDWAAREGWGMHWVRHTVAAEMEHLGQAEGFSGRAVKQRFLRHKPNGQTDGYGQATIEQVARVVARRTGERHPLAGG